MRHVIDSDQKQVPTGEAHPLPVSTFVDGEKVSATNPLPIKGKVDDRLETLCDTLDRVLVELKLQTNILQGML